MKYLSAESNVTHFSASEAHYDTHLIALCQKLLGVVELGLKIVCVNTQKKILYSLDKENWFEVQGGTYADASNDLVQTVMANGWIKSASAGHAVFENVGVDLSEYKGQTVTVSFAVTPGADDKALHFLTIENLLVPAPVETTEETTEQATEEITTEEITTEAETVGSIQESTAEPETSPVAEKKGCGSVIGGAFAVVAILALACVVKKKD